MMKKVNRFEVIFTIMIAILFSVLIGRYFLITTPQSSLQMAPEKGLAPLVALSDAWKASRARCLPQMSQYRDEIVTVAKKYQVDPKLIFGLVLVESCGDPKAVSSSRAIGLMQIKSIVKKDTGISGNLRNPVENLKIGVAYLKKLLDHYGFRFRGQAALLVAYNEGPTATRGESEEYISSREYPAKVGYAMRLF